MRAHSTHAVSLASSPLLLLLLRSGCLALHGSIDWLVELRRSTGVSERGRRLRVAHGHAPHGTNYNITLLTSLTHPSGYVVSNPRTATNTALDFLSFLVDLVQAGHLVSGDVLVCDNASIHFAAEIQAPLELLLAVTGIRLLFTPTYSPELNPCELVFAHIKNHIYAHRSPNNHLLVDIALASASISWWNILAYYSKCILHFDE